MNIYFLSFLMTELQFDSVIKSDLNMPSQTHRFGKGVLNILKLFSSNTSACSFMPVSNYPRNNKIFYRGEYNVISNVEVRSLPFCNIIFFKHLTRLISLFFLISDGNFKKSDCIVIHGVHSPYLIFAKIIKILLKKRIFVIMTDPPSQVYKTDSKIARILKKLDRGFVKSLLVNERGIVLTERLGADFFAKDCLLLDSICTQEPVLTKKTNKKNVPIIIIYAGLLQEEYGVGELLEATKYLRDLSVKIKLFGRGDLNVDEINFDHNMVEFCGYVNERELSEHYKQASILINPRKIDMNLNNYSFPSKLIEYLATGIPVISTKLPAISSDLHEYIHFTGDSAQEIAQSIRRVLSDENRWEIARDGAFYVSSTRSPEAYSNKFLKFFDNQ